MAALENKLSGSAGIGFTPHVITVKTGEDVSSKIMSFSQHGPRAVCILSANGAISNVTLRQAATSGGTVTYEGRFEILSLSGSFLLSESGGQRSRTGGLSVSLAGPDGRVLGGGVAGLLTAASPVQVVVGSFIAGKKEPKQVNNPLEPMSAPGKLAPVPAPAPSSPTSRGTLSESSGGPGSPLNQSTGTCNNSNQQGQRAENDPTVIDAPIKAEKFAQRYTAMLEDMKKNPESNGGPPDCVVLRELGFRDIFKKVKDEENAKAISLFEGVVRLNDAIEDDSKRVENLIRGILAGNIFDLGSAQLAEVFAKDGMSFLASCQNLVSRPWVIDDLDDFKMKWTTKTWKKLKDENGQLMGVDASGLLIANSGNDLPVIDLSNVSPDLAYLARRAIETNLYAQLKCDSIKIGMVSSLNSVYGGDWAFNCG
ncbi:AT hook motif domain containing protein, partial [Musa troglodytarum]